MLFELAVTKAWLRQVIVGLRLICRSSYRRVVEFLRDLLGLPVSLRDFASSDGHMVEDVGENAHVEHRIPHGVADGVLAALVHSACLG